MCRCGAENAEQENLDKRIGFQRLYPGIVNEQGQHNSNGHDLVKDQAVTGFPFEVVFLKQVPQGKQQRRKHAEQHARGYRLVHIGQIGSNHDSQADEDHQPGDYIAGLEPVSTK